MENARSKIKLIKTGEKIGTTYCDNLKPQEIKMTNKVLRENVNCVIFRSSKSIFLKQKQNNPIKRKHTFLKLKNLHMYCKNCKKHTGNTFSKKIFLISKNKIKGKSKYPIYLTERTFIHEIEDKYDLESELEIYLQFFTDSCYKRT